MGSSHRLQVHDGQSCQRSKLSSQSSHRGCNLGLMSGWCVRCVGLDLVCSGGIPRGRFGGISMVRTSDRPSAIILRRPSFRRVSTQLLNCRASAMISLSVRVLASGSRSSIKRRRACVSVFRGCWHPSGSYRGGSLSIRPDWIAILIQMRRW
jgi:hypothetical protein